MDFGPHGELGFRPLGAKKVLDNMGINNNKHWRKNATVLGYGLLTTDKPSIATAVCQEAPISRGVQQVSAVLIDTHRETRACTRYIVGDAEDIARFWADGVSWRQWDPTQYGISWCGLNSAAWAVPYMEIEETNDTLQGLNLIWPRVEITIEQVTRELAKLTEDTPEFLILYAAEVDGEKTKHCFHIHIPNFICQHIYEWRVFLSNIPVPRKKEGEDLTTAPIYDLASYGRPLRGPFCGRKGRPDSIFVPSEFFRRRDPATDVFSYERKQVECDKASVILKTRIAVPCISSLYTQILFNVNVERVIGVNTVVVDPCDHSAVLDFLSPIIEKSVIPLWQQHRAKEARGLVSTRGCSVPTANLSSVLQPVRSIVHKYEVKGDTYCEMSPEHFHENGAQITCCIDPYTATIWQECSECKVRGKPYSFLLDNEVAICSPTELTSNKHIMPVKDKFHSFLLSYYHDMFLCTKLSAAKLVYDEASGIWVEGDRGNAIVGELADNLNRRYRRYVSQIHTEWMNRKLNARTEILVQQGLPHEDYQKAKDEEMDIAKKALKDIGPFMTINTQHRSKFITDMRVYQCSMQIEDTDPLTHLVPMKNGECYNIYTGECRKIQKTDYFTSVCNAELSRDVAAMKLIEEWFNEVACGNADMVLVLKRVAAYLMTMQTHDRKFYVLQGNGKNGKGVFKEFISRILLGAGSSPPRMGVLPHTYWETTRNANSENASPMTMTLLNKTMYYTDDMPRISIASGRLKSLVAHEVASGRPLYGDVIKFRPKGKVLWTTNAHAGLQGEDNASWERYVLLMFMCKYVDDDRAVDQWRIKQDRVRMDAILDETDAFFTVTMRTLTQYYQSITDPGAETPRALGPLPIPNSLTIIRKAARHRELPLARFVDTILTPADQNYCSVGSAFDAYLTFLERENESVHRKKTTLQVFEDLLNAAMDISIRDGCLYGYSIAFDRIVRPRHE